MAWVFVVNMDSYLGRTGHNYFLHEKYGILSRNCGFSVLFAAAVHRVGIETGGTDTLKSRRC